MKVLAQRNFVEQRCGLGPCSKSPTMHGCVNFQLRKFTFFRNNFSKCQFLNVWNIKTICWKEGKID